MEATKGIRKKLIGIPIKCGRNQDKSSWFFFCVTKLIIVVGLISWDAFFFSFFLVLDFRSKFFNNFKKNYYCNEQLLVSKKMTSVVRPNVKLWSDVIWYCTNWIVNCKKKKNRVPPNVTKIRLKVMLVLLNVIIELSNFRIKNRVLLNVTKI